MTTTSDTAAARRGRPTGRYQVVRIDNGRENPPTDVISSHATLTAALDKIESMGRALRSRAGYETAHHPVMVLDTETGREATDESYIDTRSDDALEADQRRWSR